jgi:hypothetical protein
MLEQFCLDDRNKYISEEGEKGYTVINTEQFRKMSVVWNNLGKSEECIERDVQVS